MKKMKVNEMVRIHDGNSDGVFIHERVITGTVIKVNEKSIRVHMTRAKCTTNGKVTCEYDMNEKATFAFWKTVENVPFGRNAGKIVDIYKNNLYGIIEIVH